MKHKKIKTDFSELKKSDSCWRNGREMSDEVFEDYKHALMKAAEKSNSDEPYYAPVDPTDPDYYN